MKGAGSSCAGLQQVFRCRAASILFITLEHESSTVLGPKLKTQTASSQPPHTATTPPHNCMPHRYDSTCANKVMGPGLTAKV
jgi:hypothetical protein